MLSYLFAYRRAERQSARLRFMEDSLAGAWLSGCTAYMKYLCALDHEPDDLVYAALLLFPLSVLCPSLPHGVYRALDEICEQRRAQDHRRKDCEDLQI